MLLVDKPKHGRTTAVKNLISAFGDAIVGVSSGFDRIVFQGMIRPLMYPEGAMGFFDRRRILYKDTKQWFTEHTERLYCAVQQWSLRECGERIKFLPSSKTRKDELARQRQEEKEIKGGPVGVWSCVESGGTYRLARAEGAPILQYYPGHCRHLYTYLDHADYGFMSIRMQTWFPYRIQIAMNGREWLARQLEKAEIGFERLGNPPGWEGGVRGGGGGSVRAGGRVTRSCTLMTLAPCSHSWISS